MGKRPLFTVAILTGREEQEALFARWLSIARAQQAGAEAAIPPALRGAPAQLIADCVDMNDRTFLLPTLRALARQTFRDFEVLIIECTQGTRPWYERPSGLDVRTVPPRDTPWIHEPWPESMQPGPWHWSVRWPIVSCARNTAIVHARGERLIFLADCAIFDEHLLEVMAEHVRRGVLPGSWYSQIIWPDYGVARGECEDGWPKVEFAPPHTTQSFVADRADLERYELPDECVSVNTPSGLPRNCVPFLVDDWLAINGSDENFDGAMGTEDIDLFARLRRLPQFNRQTPFVRDSRLLVWELGHYHFQWLRPAARHNPLLYEMIEESSPGRLRANDERPSADFWAEYATRASGLNCYLPACFDMMPPAFDLAAEREALGNWVP